MQVTNHIRVATSLDHHGIEQLISDNITALIIKNFYPVKPARRIAKKIIASETLANYTHEIIQDDELLILS